MNNKDLALKEYVYIERETYVNFVKHIIKVFNDIDRYK